MYLTHDHLFKQTFVLLKNAHPIEKIVWLQDNHKTGQSEHLPSTNEITKQLKSA